jgi:hypothetical protein
MNRNQAKELLPFIQALAEGKPIQLKDRIGNWMDIDFINVELCNPNVYRIKPELKYRPFKDAEECWQEMLKHQPFGWLKYKKYPYFALITTIHSGNTVSLNGKEGWDFLHIMNDYVFADNIPFGVKVEE